MPNRLLKVVIVGGSVAGLTLANCLEKAGIEYVLLERGEQIVYEGGASIGLMPNGLRIMDQLDVYEAIRKATEPLAATYHRTKDVASYATSNYMYKPEEIKRSTLRLMLNKVSRLTLSAGMVILRYFLSGKNFFRFLPTTRQTIKYSHWQESDRN